MTELTYKVFNKHTFIEAAIEGEKIGFNRILSPLALDDELPADKVFPIIEVMNHEHIAGKPVELHYWGKIVLPSAEMVIMDMTTKTYHGLPEVVVDHPENEEEEA